MRPSVHRCSTTRLPSLATWTYTRTAEPRASGLAELSHTCTGLSPRPATVTGAGAGEGDIWNCNTRSGTIGPIMGPPFDRYSKLNIAALGGPLPITWRAGREEPAPVPAVAPRCRSRHPTRCEYR